MRNPVGSLQPVTLHPQTLAQYQFHFKVEYRGIWGFIKYYPLNRRRNRVSSAIWGGKSNPIYTYANIYISLYIVYILLYLLTQSISNQQSILTIQNFKQNLSIEWGVLTLILFPVSAFVSNKIKRTFNFTRNSNELQSTPNQLHCEELGDTKPTQKISFNLDLAAKRYRSLKFERINIIKIYIFFPHTNIWAAHLASPFLLFECARLCS